MMYSLPPELQFVPSKDESKKILMETQKQLLFYNPPRGSIQCYCSCWFIVLRNILIVDLEKQNAVEETSRQNIEVSLQDVHNKRKIHLIKKDNGPFLCYALIAPLSTSVRLTFTEYHGRMHLSGNIN
mmetsp:Transcript_55624/g.82374  ORF Transcript_55624/g.82374 Transcript_55624/m.82374 type:complete len:127 (-) Transcript_55624:23-403(-)